MRPRIGSAPLLVVLGLLVGCDSSPTRLTAPSAAREDRAVAPAPGPRCPADVTLVDLGSGKAEDINDHGAVVGTNGRAFLWTATAGIRDLGPGDAHGINNAEAVVGESGGRPFLWTAATGMRDLGTQEFFETGVAFAVNDPGVAVGGEVSQLLEFGQAVYWTAPDQIHVLPGGGDISQALDVNNHGQAVGYGAFLPFTSEAFLWTIGGATVRLAPLLCCGGSSEAFFSIARGINELGQVVGEATLTTDISLRHAFLWSPTAGATDLGTLGGSGSAATEINDQGQVVGYSLIAGDAATHAFLWTATEGMRDLGTRAGASDSKAYSINNLGQIVGESGGHAVLWTLGPTTAAARLAALGQRIDALVTAGTLSNGEANALRAKLDAAARALAHEPPTPAARNVLDAFVNQVDALVRSGRLASATGAALIDAARCVVA